MAGMRIKLVSDIHGAAGGLREAAAGADALLVCGDLVNLIDYRTMEGIAVDVFEQSDAVRELVAADTLGGLHAALSACQNDWAIVVACDLPFVTAELFSFLAQRRLDHDAVVPIQQDGRPQPLAALYRVDPCLQRAIDLIEAGRRRPLDLLNAVNTRWVEFDQLTNLDQAERFFVNINTPSDYDEAIRGHSH